MSVYKGIFWCVPNEKRLITVKVKCDRNGVALEDADYSSKSRKKKIFLCMKK